MIAHPVLILLARVPEADRLDPALVTALGAQGAEHFAAERLRLAVDNATDHWPGEVWLAGWPDGGHALLAELADRYHLQSYTLHGADPVARRLNAVRDGIAHGNAVALLDGDVPHCPWHELERAEEYLARGEAVIGPSSDGGYYLIGLAGEAVDLFSGVPWGTPMVRSVTLARGAAHDIEFEQLLTLRRIRDCADLAAVDEPLTALRDCCR